MLDLTSGSVGDLKIREFRVRQIIKRSEAVLARVSERRLLRERFAIGEASTKYHRNRGGARRAIYPRLALVSKLLLYLAGGWEFAAKRQYLCSRRP